VFRGLVISLLLTFGSWASASACAIAPHFNDNEFGSPSVALENFATNASIIFKGRVNKVVRPGKIKFQIIELIKSPNEFSTVTVNYNHIHSTYHFEGVDEKTIKNDAELLEFTSLVRTVGEEKSSIKASGGVLAGIFHGSDCERKTMTYDKQDYLLFLDKRLFVMAKFPIESNNFNNLASTVTMLENSLRSLE
jgi:hypothetical protein